ncbi:hypothetical protein GYMLUDRAFT_62166 [Collybiopsis luxurians FD-317 M1]|uniref:Uncharacterized protein n=1 Tax=Collybiopsis luxurians FD-317 M1 TaxID=944289 RepID=A0A0D0BMI7_9AGAR|nr:hypothetical protein GYMLUDRAFT_62166 [Collybiopsis luxurians FD-317 M1]
MKQSFRPTSPEPLPSLRRTSEWDTVSLLGRGKGQTEDQVSLQRKTCLVTQKYTQNVKSNSSKLFAHTTAKDRKISGNAEIFMGPTPKSVLDSIQTAESKSHDSLNMPDGAQTFDKDFELPTSTMQNEDNNDVNKELSLYVDAIQSECIGFIKLYDNLFTVEGWNKATGMGTNKWSHFEVTTDLSGEHRMLCSCHLGSLSCFHKRYFKLHGQDDSKTTQSHVNEGICPHVILFTKERMDYDGE